jgi:phytoene dehydrogenase-like protein
VLDAVVIGAGPNGLTAAAKLARSGWKVLVLEAQARAGGAAATLPLTEPGFVHDIGAAFFPFGPISPAFLDLDLIGAGLRFALGTVDSAHLARDGSCGILARDTERMVAELGVDGAAWRKLARWRADMGDERFAGLTLGALPLVGPALALGFPSLARLGLAELHSSGSFAERFRTSPAQRIIPQLSLHADVGPDDPAGAPIGLVLALSALSVGFPIAVGGTGAIAQALLHRFSEAGGELRLSTRVSKVIVRSDASASGLRPSAGRAGFLRGAAVGVRTASGEEIEARAVLADTSAPTLCLDLVGAEHLPGRLFDAMRVFPHAWGTFKLDWALDGPIPWQAASAREAAVVHLGGDVPELRAFTQQVRRGEPPLHPYLVLGQQSLCDPSRAPPGKHTLWGYSHVPSEVPGGWASQRERFADRVDDEIEAHAPGFKQLVRARAIAAPQDLQAWDENLVGGDLGGGSAQLGNQFFWRPAFPYFNYRMGLRGLYLCSASAHPGAGVHGACGWNAAKVALSDYSPA